MARAGLYPGVSFDPRALLPNRGAAAMFPFSGPRMHTFGLARTAIWYGVQVLGLRPGDEVLVPAYNCGSEIDPLIQAGLTLVYYNVDEALDARSAEIAALITPRTKALYLTHYLGFPQKHARELAATCKSSGVTLIEDCAHGLFGRYEDGQPLGTLGDIAVFSFRKTLPIGDGAALVLNRPDLPGPRGALRHTLLPPSVATWRHTPSRAYHALRSHVGSGRAAPVVPAKPPGAGVDLPGPLLPLEHRFVPAWHERGGMSLLAERVAARANPAEVTARRRENFSAILENAFPGEGFRPLFARLPEGTVPLVFPFLAEDPERLVTVLEARGIPAQRWWFRFHPQCPWESFPEAVYLKTHLVAAAVRQDIDADTLAAAVRALRGPDRRATVDAAASAVDSSGASR
ncbi:MAG: DegT/DnrJ/EryC1/StrS family aminotransferase [Chloroflexi bacterium]|nr:DegT/DnrJ/EryC1/StrS family aminotransferase [Chloroflexota bacterium]